MKILSQQDLTKLDLLSLLKTVKFLVWHTVLLGATFIDGKTVNRLGKVFVHLPIRLIGFSLLITELNNHCNYLNQMQRVL